MTELFLSFLLGGFFVYLAIPKRKDFKEQLKIYQDRIDELNGNLEFYKKWCKKIAEENSQMRRKK